MRRHLSVSSGRLYLECPRKYQYRHVLGFTPVDTPHALVFGRICHAGLNTIWEHGKLVPAEGGTDFDRATVDALLAGYVARWGMPTEEHEVESRFETPLPNPAGGESESWLLVGYIDAMWRSKNQIVEHKTTSSDASAGSMYWETKRLDPQISVYIFGARVLGMDPESCLYDVIRKPGIRPFRANKKRKEDETAEQYGQRLYESIEEDPNRYYVRGKVVRLESEEQDAKETLWGIAQLIDHSRECGMWPQNSDACLKWGRRCEYFDVCTKCGSLDDGFMFRETRAKG